MTIHDLCEAATEEFRWYENPTLKQINDVAGEKDKVRFVAYPSKKVIVFPYDESPKEFLTAIKQPLDPEGSIHGIAQKAGVAWLVNKIVNLKHLAGKFNSKDWVWLNKYLNFSYFLKMEPKHSTKELGITKGTIDYLQSFYPGINLREFFVMNRDARDRIAELVRVKDKLNYLQTMWSAEAIEKWMKKHPKSNIIYNLRLHDLVKETQPNFDSQQIDKGQKLTKTNLKDFVDKHVEN
jgi:hypothetical protein